MVLILYSEDVNFTGYVFSEIWQREILNFALTNYDEHNFITREMERSSNAEYIYQSS